MISEKEMKVIQKENNNLKEREQSQRVRKIFGMRVTVTWTHSPTAFGLGAPTPQQAVLAWTQLW